MLDTQAQYVVSTVLCLQPAHYASPATTTSCLTRLALLAMADAEALRSGLHASGFRG